MEIKYTSDGKKVGIVGKLNSQETIVQEIFVSENQEIPSGENFVVKSLHDAPVVSWKEKNLKDLEERYQKEYKEWERKIDDLDKRYRAQCTRAELLINESKKFADLCEIDKSLETISDVLTGKVKFVIKKGYGPPELFTWEKFHLVSDKRLKLISLLGGSNGELTWRINAWSDGSGGNDVIFLFTDKEPAVEKFIELCKESYISEKIIELAKEYGFELDPEKLQIWKTQTKESNQKRIDEATANIEKWKIENEKISAI